MPIADTDGYPTGHFKHVYDNIISPACSMAGFRAVRADDVKASNLIHLDILRKLIEAPVAICDLSSRNPNVLFELGIRQAFDRPVVLVQESGTPKIFDIAPLRYLEYSKDMKYHDVLRTQAELKVMVEATIAAGSDAGNVNSIVKLLALNQPARIPELGGNKEELALGVLQAEVRELRKLMESTLAERSRVRASESLFAIEYDRILRNWEAIKASKLPRSARVERMKSLAGEIEQVMRATDDKDMRVRFGRLLERIMMESEESRITVVEQGSS